MNLSIREAAEHLGISENAVVKRLRRGTLEGTKDEAGRWTVTLPDGRTDGREDLIAELRARLEDKDRQIRFLEDQLERKDSIIMAQAQRALPPPPDDERDRRLEERDRLLTEGLRQIMERMEQQSNGGSDGGGSRR